MGNSGDPRPSATTQSQESAPLDVSDQTLLELLKSSNPVIIEAAERLLARRIELPEQILLGWNSMIKQVSRDDL
jgi:hypothetical protein